VMCFNVYEGHTVFNSRTKSKNTPLAKHHTMKACKGNEDKSTYS
jgi:hypothetical protein